MDLRIISLTCLSKTFFHIADDLDNSLITECKNIVKTKILLPKGFFNLQKSLAGQFLGYKNMHNAKDASNILGDLSEPY